jgi:hypothetical protein
MASMTTDDQYANRVFVKDAKQNSIWKTAHQAAPYSALNYGVLGWVCAYPLNRGIDFRPEIFTEAKAFLVVVLDGAIEVGCREGVILDPHSELPLVRRTNSA